MTRDERRRRTAVKIRQRENLLCTLGVQQGTAYEKQREKILVSCGYMRTGNVTHFVSVRKYRRYYKRDKEIFERKSSIMSV